MTCILLAGSRHFQIHIADCQKYLLKLQIRHFLLPRNQEYGCKHLQQSNKLSIELSPG